jgi:hypothetical protein
MMSDKQSVTVLSNALSTYLHDHLRDPQNLDLQKRSEREVIVGVIRDMEMFIHTPVPAEIELELPILDGEVTINSNTTTVVGSEVVG